MKTICVTIAIGEPFETIAASVLKRWASVHNTSRWFGGIEPPVKILGRKEFDGIRDSFSSRHSAWLKPHLFDLFPEYDQIVYVDADTYTIRPWLHLVDDAAHIAACIDPPEPRRQVERPTRKQFKADWYFNNGVFVIRRTPETLDFMKLWWELRKRKWDILPDQDPFNRALLDLGSRLRVQVLPPSCNHIINASGIPSPEDRPHVLHWAGVKAPVRDREMRLMSLIP